MDILKLLTENAKDIIPQDIDFIESEIYTGDFDKDYKQRCIEKLQEIRNRMKIKKTDIPHKKVLPYPLTESSGVYVDPAKLTPDCQKKSKIISLEEKLKQKLEFIRSQPKNKSLFKEFVLNNDYLTEEFIDKNFYLFEYIEINELIKFKQFSEDFLERHFYEVSHEYIAKYQLFSEVFFMQHFNELDFKIIVNGKNPWCKKENRSTKLDVFLRLKGIRI